MPDKSVIPVGGTKEAPLTVVAGSGVVAHVAPEQDYTEQQDSIRHSEILRIIATAMQRWRATICTPEYFTGYTPRGETDDREDWSWDYGIKCPPTDPPRISPKARFGEVGDNEIWIEVLEENGSLSHDFTFTAYGNEAFRDPFTGEEIRDLEVIFRQHGDFVGRDCYDVSITEGYYIEPGGDVEERNLEYFIAGFSTGKPYVNIQKSYDHSSSELLSEPHALALFDLMDTLIPNTPIPTPQTERRVTPEPPTSPALPHPGRRPAGQ